MYRQSARQSPRRAFALLTAALVAAACLAGGKALWFLAYAVAGAWALAWAHALAGRAFLRGAISAPKAAIAAGDELVIRYSLENPSALSFPAIDFYECAAFSRGADAQDARRLSLGPRSSASWESRIRFDRRGKYAVGEATVSMRDLYGLFELRKSLRSPLSITVYPRISPLDALWPEGMRQLGDIRVRDPFARDLSETAALRSYRDGDPYQHIHWRLSARSDEPVCKVFERRGDAGFDIILDGEARHYAGDPDGILADLAADAAISLIDYLLARGAACTLFLGGRRVSDGSRVSGSSRADAAAFLDALAEFQPQGRHGALESELSACLEGTDKRRSVTLLSPRATAAAALGLIRLKLGGKRPSLLLLESAEAEAGQEERAYLHALKAEGIPVLKLSSRGRMADALKELR